MKVVAWLPKLLLCQLKGSLSYQATSQAEQRIKNEHLKFHIKYHIQILQAALVAAQFLLAQFLLEFCICTQNANESKSITVLEIFKRFCWFRELQERSQHERIFLFPFGKRRWWIFVVKIMFGPESDATHLTKFWLEQSTSPANLTRNFMGRSKNWFLAIMRRV